MRPKIGGRRSKTEFGIAGPVGQGGDREREVDGSGYVIYRSRLNGASTVTGVPIVGSEFREMLRVPRAGATTVYVDSNQTIPGSTNAYILNMLPSAGAITWRQLLPMLKFPLYPTQSAVIPWAQLLFGYLRLAKRKQHAVIRNIVTNTQVWRPFN